MSRLFVWGKASSGQLALGGIEEDLIKTPMEVPNYAGFASKVLDVACGWEHTAFLTDDGIVYTCGNNDSGQLGHTKSTKKPGKVNLTKLLDEFSVACTSSLAINVLGYVYFGVASERREGSQ